MSVTGWMLAGAAVGYLIAGWTGAATGVLVGGVFVCWPRLALWVVGAALFIVLLAAVIAVPGLISGHPLSVVIPRVVKFLAILISYGGGVLCGGVVLRWLEEETHACPRLIAWVIAWAIGGGVGFSLATSAFLLIDTPSPIEAILRAALLSALWGALGGALIGGAIYAVARGTGIARHLIGRRSAKR